MTENQDNKKYKNVAVILAGGTGSRLGGEIPKQFLKICGKTVIEYSLDAFERNENIDEIAVVVHSDYISRMNEIVSCGKWTKVKKILQGGSERYLSSISAIEAYGNEPETRLIFHDAARPLVSNRIIDDVAAALLNHDAVCVAVPSADTIFQVNSAGELLVSIPDRKFLRRAQTPQAFKLSVVRNAYNMALKDPDFVCTDDCGTVIRYMPETPIFVVNGENKNLKLTYKEDIYLIERFLQISK